MSGLRETYVRLGMQDEASNVLHNVNRLMTRVVNKFQQLGSNIDTSTTGFNSMTQEVIRLNRRLDTSTTEINSLRTELSQSSQEMASLRTLVNRLEGELNQARLEVQQMQNAMQGLNQQAQQAEGSFGGIGATVAGIAASLGTIDFGTGLISDALEIDDAFGRLAARTGASGHELKEYEAIARSVFVNGFTDSIGEASDSISTFAAMFPKLDYGGLDVITQGAHTIGQTWDQEAKEVGKTVATMTKTFEGLGESQALDLITTAFQRTGDHSDDLLDTFNEYSTQFKALGYDAEGFTATLIAGAESGAFNFDKLADTAKEGFLKMGEGSKDTRDALKTMGLNADQVITGIGKGGDEAQKSFMAVSTALASIEDPAERNQLAIAAFGTPLEDLGPQFATFFGSVNQDLGDFEGATERAADAMKDRFGPRMQSAWRDLKLSMVEAFQTEGMQKFLGALAEDVEAALPSIKAGFASFASTISNNIVPAYEAFKVGLVWLKDNGPTIGAVVTGLATGFAAFHVITTVQAGFSALSTALAVYRTAGLAAAAAQLGLNTAMLANPLGWVTAGIGALVTAGVLLWQNWDTVKTKASELWAKLRENPMMAMVVGPIGAVIAAGVTLYNNWGNIQTKAGELGTTVTEKFADIRTSISSAIQPVIGWFTTLSTKWNSFKASISNFKMPKWMSSVGSAISGAASKVGSLFNGSHATGLANVPFNGYRAELHAQESVLTANQSNALRAAGILSANSDGTPNVDLSSVATPVATVSASSRSGGAPIMVSIPVTVQGNADSSTIEQLKSMMSTEVYAILEDIFRKKAAGLE